MTNTFSTSIPSTRPAVKISSFYPFATNLKDLKVLLLGGGDQAYREILRLMDAGAKLTIVAADPIEPIREILVTHGSRASLLHLSGNGFLAAVDTDKGKAGLHLEDFALAFLLSDDTEENELVCQRLSDCGVPCNVLYQPEKSKFVTATPLKRGHLRIAVSTDGLCHPLERAISRQIEEMFVYDFDHYSLFLSAIEEKLAALKEKDESKWILLNQRLDGEDFYLALARKNFEEALRMVDLFIAAIERGGEEDEPEAEIEMNRPRGSTKGGQK